LGAGPAQIIWQQVLPRLYGCRRLCPSPSFGVLSRHLGNYTDPV